jgi:Calcineurin-like phosphoesterase
MRLAILHISDLHRDPRDELANGPLLESLLRDVDRYPDQTPPILRPSLCIVSGDLIYGVSPTRKDFEVELDRQYTQGVDFLISLADALFDGNRDRVVLLPGNHDVSYPTALASCTRIDVPATPAERTALVNELFAPNSRLRWSWSEMCFFRIHDQELYEQRLSSFAKAYARFYSGSRSFSLAPELQFCVFDYPALGFSIVALNSCYRNDPLQRAGSFHPSALSSACRELASPHRAGWLLAATWHHSVGGGPVQNDFLDHEFVQLLIDSGVSLGFHGHQHTYDCVDERYRLGPVQRKMTIVSASTLCADPGNLKPGVPRGFNVVEIDTDIWSGRAHSRHMVNSSFNLPVWGPGLFNATGKSYMDFEINRPLLRRPPQLDKTLLLERADELLGKRSLKEALDILEQVRDDPFAKPLVIDALTQLGDDERTLNILWPPSGSAEIILVGAAILNLQERERAEAFLRLDAVSNNSDSSVADIKRRIATRWFR